MNKNVIITFHYKNGEKKQKEKMIWFCNEPFCFSDDSNLEAVSINNYRFNTQAEYDAFYRGILLIRDILSSFTN